MSNIVHKNIKDACAKYKYMQGIVERQNDKIDYGAFTGTINTSPGIHNWGYTSEPKNLWIGKNKFFDTCRKYPTFRVLNKIERKETEHISTVYYTYEI